MKIPLAFALLLLAGSAARAARVSSYDGKLAMRVPDSWSMTPGEAFRGPVKPAFVLNPIVHDPAGLPALIVTAFADGQGPTLEAAARAAYAERKAKAKPGARMTELAPVKFGALAGFGYGAVNPGGQAFDTFYLELAGARYQAVCFGAWEKDCMAALGTLAAGGPKPAAAESAAPFQAKIGAAVRVPSGYSVLKDEPGLFFALTGAESCQLRRPLPMPASAYDGSAATARALRGAFRLAFRKPLGEPSALRSAATAQGPLYYVTAVDAEKGQAAVGHWVVGGAPLLAICLAPGEPAGRLETFVGAKTAP